jgi:hypothetical protein
MTTRARLLRWAFLFLVVLYVHFRGIATLYDSLWTIPTTLSIIHQGNIDLDEYASVIREGDYRVTTLNGHLYPTFPIGGSVIAVPFVLVIDKVWGLSGLDLYEQLQQYSFEDRPQEWMITEVFIASFIVAVTSVLLYILAGWYLKRGHALLVAGVFAFCTSAWSTASRALWQHGPSMLMLTMTLCLFVAAKKRPWLIQLAGVPLAFSFVVRPTNAISVLLLTVLVFVEHRPYFVRFVLWATLIVAVPFLLFNVSLYASVLPPYYREMIGKTPLGTVTALGANPDFFGTLAANLISPSRGLFVFSPILLFSIYGMISKWRRGEMERLDYFLLGIIFLHWIVISSYSIWWGGWSFGPRFFADMIPYFMYFLIPGVAAVGRSAGRRGVALTAVLIVLMIASCFIHYRGATSSGPQFWNAFPENIDLAPERVWDWRDPQFLRRFDLDR